MNKKLGVILCLIFVSSCLAHGQKIISGTCKDSTTDKVVASVEIFNLTENRSIQADEQGSFEIAIQRFPTVLAYFSMSYETKYDTIFTASKDIIVELRPLQIGLEALTIQARRKEFFGLKQLTDTRGMTIMSGKKVEIVSLENTVANLANNNGRQIYAKVSGLNIYEGNDGGMQLNIGGRGLDPNRTSNFNTRQNHYDISADVLGYPESYYVPPPEALEDIEVIRGAASLQYGTQFGGLINFNLREIPNFNTFHIRASQTIGSFGFRNLYLYTGINKKKFSVNAHLNYKAGDGYRSNSEYENLLGIISMKYQINSTSFIQAELTSSDYLAQQAGGLTDSQFIQNPRQSTRVRNWFAVDWNLYNVRYQNEFSGGDKLSVSLFGLDASRSAVGYRGNPIDINSNPITALDEQDLSGNYISPRDLMIGEFNNIGLESKYLRSIVGSRVKQTLLIGTKVYAARNTAIQGAGATGSDADFNSYSADYPAYPLQSSFTFPNFNASLFAEDIIYLGDKLSITPGIRFEYIRTGIEGSYQAINYDLAGNPISNQTLTDERALERFFPLFGVGISYKSNRKLEYYGNISQNYRSVTFSDIRTVNPTFIIDPEISDESGFTADFGLRGAIGDYFSYDASLYSIYYADRIGIVLDDRANRVRKNIGVALISGLETLIEYNLSKHRFPDSNWEAKGFLNTALTDARYLSSEEVNVEGKVVEFVPFLNLKSGFSLGWKQLIASLQYGRISKQFTDVQNSDVAAANSLRDGIIGPIPGYGVFDLTISSRYRRISAQFMINNMSNVEYFTRRATGYPGPGIIPSEGRGYYLSLTYEIIK